MSSCGSPSTTRINYRAVDVDGTKIFYRQAGPRDTATILLLHGFPSASHMFRDLIPILSERFQVVAPDLPGFGQSDMPARDRFSYTFENIANAAWLTRNHDLRAAGRDRRDIGAGKIRERAGRSNRLSKLKVVDGAAEGGAPPLERTTPSTTGHTCYRIIRRFAR